MVSSALRPIGAVSLLLWSSAPPHFQIRSGVTGAVARNFIWGRVQYKGGRRSLRGGWETFSKFCFEMMHFGAKVTNALHHRWFSVSYSEKTNMGLIKIVVIISGEGGR